MSANVTTQIPANYGKVLLAVALDPKAVGRRLKDARVAKGLTQLTFALQAGVSPSIVSKWERATPLPPVRELLRIADLLDVQACDLVDPDEEPASVSVRLGRLEEEAAETRAILENVARALGVAVPDASQDEEPAI